MLELKSIHFSYRPQTSLLQDISLTIEDGEFLAVAGRNGSGKTTLSRLMMALRKPTRGKMLLDGKDTAKYTPADMARHIGYVFQNPDRQIFRDTVAAEVSYGPEQLGYTAGEIDNFVEETLAVTGLTQLAQAYPPTLSKGQKQRLAIASALAMQPRMLILDEPTSGQDARERQQLQTLFFDLNQQGKTILLITHDMNLLAECAGRVIVMNQGCKAFDGSPAELFRNTDRLKQWGLQQPTATKISRQLGACGVNETASMQQLSHSLIKLLGRTGHDDNRPAY